ncbi:MAG TPA: nucleotide exchange factor GrpE [Streptosporangiaceae bacterium]|nr:nucleotide exchange factor GrpE [Streptosporangiaceae bacterium]
MIRDLRRIDPATGQVRDSGQGGSAQPGSRGPSKPRGKHAASRPGGAASMGAAAPAGPGARPGAGRPGADRAGAEQADQAAPAAADLKAAEQQLAERTADLQRVTAEYANYRKRVERDRAAVREQAVANVLSGLVPVLDDIGRAREHEELVGGFKSVAESLEAAVTKLGLESFGEDGEPFDPKVHEALMHSYSPDVTEPVCIKILQPGYRVGERILRPARVEVAEPGEAGAAAEPDGPGSAEGPDEPDDAAGGGGVHHQPSGGSGDASSRQETSADDD